MKKTSHYSLKGSTFNEVLKKYSKSKTFVESYNEELNRLRLAKQIKDIREKSKMSQTQLSEKINMPQSVIARIESGRHSVSLSTLSKIAIGLGKEIVLR